jgi:hypothetical protein
MRSKLVIKSALLILTLLCAAIVVSGQASDKSKTPKFSTADRATINAYYKSKMGNLAPGSLDRKGLPPDIDRALVVGAKLPEQLEKKLENLPADLEKKVSLPAGGYQMYKLEHHVLILRRSDREIADIIRDAGWK